MLRLEFKRRQVVQAHVRSDRIVVPSPSLENNSGFGAIAKPFHAQAFVTEFPVEGLVGTVLPGFAPVHQRCLDAFACQPRGLTIFCG